MDTTTWPAGRTIVGVRPMTDEELELAGWDGFSRPSAILVLDDGSLLYPSCDVEGNAGGALFGVTDGDDVVIFF